MQFTSATTSDSWFRLAVASSMLTAAMTATGKDTSCVNATEVEQLRTELALTQLQAELLRERSATKVLESWCGKYQIAGNPTVRAEVRDVADKVPSAETMARLQVSKPEQVAYRRVALRCGSVLLSEADNWYVPARLTQAMNLQLASSDLPFGKVVADLRPLRVTVTAKPLWSALDDGNACRVKPITQAAAPDAVLLVQALLYREDLKPFSEVHEVYQRPLIAAAGSCRAAP